MLYHSLHLYISYSDCAEERLKESSHFFKVLIRSNVKVGANNICSSTVFLEDLGLFLLEMRLDRESCVDVSGTIDPSACGLQCDLQYIVEEIGCYFKKRRCDI